MDGAVDLRRVALAAALAAGPPALVDDDLEPPADFPRELFRADRLLPQHQALVARRLDPGRHRGKSQIVGRRALYRLVLEGADAVELRLIEPVEQELEILLGLAGKTDDEGRADRQLRAERAPCAGFARASFPGCRAAASP